MLPHIVELSLKIGIFWYNFLTFSFNVGMQANLEKILNEMLTDFDF